jgi:hypothetical protein
MKHRSNTNVITAGIFGVIAVALVAVAVFMNMRPGQAQEAPPLIEYPDMPPTPTMPPVPTTPAGLAAGNMVYESDFANESALNDWQIVDLEAVLPESRSVWAVADGMLNQARTANLGNPSPQETLALIGESDWTDYTISVKFYDKGNGNAGLVARLQGDSFYRYRILANFYEDTPKQVLEKVEDGVVTTLASVETAGYDFYTWNTLSLSVNGSTIQVILNGELVAEAEDDSLSSGAAGLYTRAIGNLAFDDVLVVAQ